MEHVDELSVQMKEVRDALSKVILGKEKEIDLILTALLSGGHLLLEDVPGTGKTTLAKALARTLGCRFGRIQFTPDLLPQDILGFHLYDQKKQEFYFRPGPIHHQILLADELNRATPRTQSSLLEAMEERQVTIEGETMRLEEPFFVIATENPVESQGTFPLPEAQLDRFLMRLSLGYPAFDEERRMLSIYRAKRPLDELAPILSGERILLARQRVEKVHVSEAVEDYLLRIIFATRANPYVEVGVSPRGSLALMKAAQAYAFIQGRTYVTPDDARHLVPHVLSHRIILSVEGELHTQVAKVLEEIVGEIPVPLEHVE